jgi:hypothetical protein
MQRLSRSYALLAVAIAACGTDPTQPEAYGVFVRTDASEYVLAPPGQPPNAASVLLENLTGQVVTVRRCLVNGSPFDPLGVDLVAERQAADGSWQPIPGLDCGAAATRADAVLSLHERALVLRLIGVAPGRIRVRVAYGIGAGAAPTDTATSAVFSFR